MTKEKPAVLVPVRVVESRLERDGEPSLLANVLPKPDGIPEASGSRLPLPGKLTQSLTQFPLVSDFTTQYQLLTEVSPHSKWGQNSRQIAPVGSSKKPQAKALAGTVTQWLCGPANNEMMDKSRPRCHRPRHVRAATICTEP